ncbi:MAG: A/G-specific adenine glycosylase [Candidatus Thorarchaeota archaeon]
MTSEITQTRLSKIRKKILRWYKTNGRVYPWRNTSSSYQILIAEMLLRRTTAAAVLRVFSDFIKRYPDVTVLSLALVREIEDSIQTLGLQNQRAKHLHDAAKIIKERFGGNISDSMYQLESLPGVGRYVASAVRNFAFGIPEPMVDGNVVHILRRVLGVQLSGMIDETAWDLMKQLGGKTQNKQLYWGIIDIVATLCLRKKPRCFKCPLDKECTYNMSILGAPQ